MNDHEIAVKIRSLIDSPSTIGAFTWVNHYSARINKKNRIDMSRFSFVGVDGQFLAYLLHEGIKTTSADRVLPLLLQDRVRVTCIGGSELNAARRLEILQRKFPKVEIVGNYDGYSFNLLGAEFLNNLEAENSELILIGTGSPLQERLALEIKSRLSRTTLNHGLGIVTCGGWLDQILVDSYYPDWSYKFKLNWLVRLVREPLRLWKRYSIHAIMALLNVIQLRNYLRKIVS